MIPSNTSTIEPLDWFPKRFQPGDMDSTGGDRLLGRTELSALEILVRETAQNSWDARLDDQRPWYGVHLRRADWRLRADLDRLLPDRNRRTPGTHLPDAPFVLEIFDRGTTGLDGPVTLRPVLGDAPRNFQDLILKLGVPRDDGKGGGTYGFGKTASYAFSRRGTVLYWTRCYNEEGRLEHRLIASAFGDSYVESGVQYTGRHWWGRLDEDSVAPLLGDEAEAVGRRFFERGFGPGETGTSMLILDPDLSPVSLGSDVADDEQPQWSESDAAAEFGVRARSAIRVHLWPKLVARPGEHDTPMQITLDVDGERKDLIGEPIGALALWGAGLNAIRSARQTVPGKVATAQNMPVEVFPITRLGKTLGHLAIVRRILALESPAMHDDLDPLHSPAVERIALMRGQPELIVETVDWVAQSPIEGVEWLAVYKASDDWDATYARTEPPAHDHWIASSGGEEGLVVRATKTRASKHIRDTLYPEPEAIQSESVPVRTGNLSRRFASLLPARLDPVAPDRPPRTANGRRARSATRVHRVEASAPRLVTTLDDGRQRQSIDFTVKADAPRSLVKISVSAIGDEGVHEPLPPDELSLTWSGAESVGLAQAIVAPDQLVAVDFTAIGRRALRIDLSAEAPDGIH
ncbi:hypothetical protein [Microbacterium thalassium]|uniref:Uncharacterized protein n=1 Tax=Microbacterium thalassium TaxID=362649 RepID=A0A7X0FS46_9MICO|nr:hypothetical protein [Microbacterium thalassium]MBB6392712.1 hypothetical protein [Microbacterium thalassium]GLK23057.1 hypothetical protein GCM10017607_03750 [Microbacterium thalassium]